jgi:transposase-like protein
MASDISDLDLLVIQIDGIHIEEDLVLVAAVGIDSLGDKHPPAVIEGATENATVAQALLDNLIERGLDPGVCRLFIVDGAKALTKALRKTFGRHTPSQRCQVHKARNILECVPKPLHASVRAALRQTWELEDADKAERLIRNLAPGWSSKLPASPPASSKASTKSRPLSVLAFPPNCADRWPCTNNIIENMMGTVRRVCRNVKRWRDASMALRWTSAAMLETAKGFRRLKTHKQHSVLRAALAAHQTKQAADGAIELTAKAA